MIELVGLLICSFVAIGILAYTDYKLPRVPDKDKDGCPYTEKENGK